MADEKVMRQAQSVYETVCKTLETRGWSFTRHDDKMMVSCGARGEDLPIDIFIIVKPEAQVVSLISPMPFSISEEKRVDAALAVCVANYGLVNGSFDYDLSDGEISFRIVSGFRESILSEELINYMILVAAGTIDDYNDKFLMVSKGMFTIQQFIDWENSRKNG